MYTGGDRASQKDHGRCRRRRRHQGLTTNEQAFSKLNSTSGRTVSGLYMYLFLFAAAATVHITARPRLTTLTSCSRFILSNLQQVA